MWHRYLMNRDTRFLICSKLVSLERYWWVGPTEKYSEKKFKVILYIFEPWSFKKLSDTGKKNHVFYKKNVNRNCFFLWIKGTWDLIWLDLCILQMRIELIFVKLTTRQPIRTVIQPTAAWHIFLPTSYQIWQISTGAGPRRPEQDGGQCCGTPHAHHNWENTH
jgi:hypothetical protein